MRIHFITQYFYPDLAAGGPVVKIGAIADRLSARGHTVTVITAQSTIRSQHGAPENDTQEDGSPVTANGLAKVIRLPTTFKYRATTVHPSVLACARRQVPRTDVIHLFGYYDMMGPAVTRVARAVGVPYLLEPMGMYVPILRSFAKKRLYHWLLGRRMVSGAARLIATSPLERSELMQAGIPAARLVERRNGVDLAEFTQMPPRGKLRRRLGISGDEQVVLYLGRLTPKKNPDLLLRAFADLDVSRRRLVMVGPSSNDGYVQHLRDLGINLGVEERVEFTGPLYGNEKLEAFSDADLFVLPSQSENFGNAVAEAVAAKVPVVVSNRCGIAPIVSDKAGLVVPPEQTAISQAIDRILSDDNLHENYRRKCSAVARELSWDGPVQEMEALYEQLIREPEGRARTFPMVAPLRPTAHGDAKHILLVSQYYMPSRQYGGPVVKLKALAETLASKGHAVTVLTAVPQVADARPVREMANGVVVVYLPSVARYRAVTINPSAWRFCRRHMREFDVVHLFGVYDLLGPIAALHAVLAGRPFVLEPLGMALPILRSISKKRLYHFLVGQHMFRKASRVIVTSQSEHDQLVDGRLVPEERLLLRRNGVDLSEFLHMPEKGSARKALGLDPKSKVVLFLGRLAPVKGLDMLLRAFARLNLAEARLVVAGPDEGDGYMAGLLQLVEKLGLRERVQFPGPIYGKQKIGLLGDADVVVLPSVFESFGNVAAEAVAAGTPVVVTKDCGIAPFIQDRVGLVTDHKASLVADAMNQLLVERELHQTFTKRCADVAREFSWDEPVMQMESLYHALDNGGN
jgi:glycosyltransferase involved in cell wall biosynthesis